MQFSYIRALCPTSQGKQRTDRMYVNSILYTVIDIVSTRLLAYHSRGWAWFKLAQPIAGAQAGPRLLALQLIDVTVAVKNIHALMLDTVISHLAPVI